MRPSLYITTVVAAAPPVVKFVTAPDSLIINGLTRHPTNPRLLLAADLTLGAIRRIDLYTGAYDIAFTDPLLTPTSTVPGTHLGINGLRASASRDDWPRASS